MKVSIKLILLTLPLLSLLMVSCGDDDSESNYLQIKPVLTEISAEEGIRGAEVTLTGTNLSDVDRVVFGNVEVADFAASETSVTATVPSDVAKGRLMIAVYSPHGSDRMEFHVINLPTVTELSVTEALPGADLIITGEDLEGVTDVTFGDVAAVFTASANTINTTVPMNAPFGEVQITLTNNGGSTQISFTVVDDPIIASFAPAAGSIGDEIFVTGNNFIDVESVTVGGVAATFIVEGSGNLSFIVPDGAANGYIMVTTAAGQVTSESQFIVKTGSATPVVIYDDARNSDWDDWGWNSDRDWANTEQPQTGTSALKVTHTADGWGAVNLHSEPAFDLTGYEKLTLSVYGAPGSEGANQTIWIKDASGTEHTKIQFPLKEGEYVTHVFTMEELGFPPSIIELFIQNNGVAGNTFYLDNVILE